MVRYQSAIFYKKNRNFSFLFFSILTRNSLLLFNLIPLNSNSKVDNDEINANYWSNEQICRKYSKRACLYICFNQISFIVSFIYSIFEILSGQFDSSTLQLPFNLVLPFDTKSPSGFYALWFFQFWLVILIDKFIFSVCDIFHSNRNVHFIRTQTEMACNFFFVWSFSI